MLLLTPGPVQTDPRVRAAMAVDIAPWDLDFRAEPFGCIPDLLARAAAGQDHRPLRRGSGGPRYRTHRARCRPEPSHHPRVDAVDRHAAR